MKGEKKEEFDYQSSEEQALKAMYRASHWNKWMERKPFKGAEQIWLRQESI